MADNELQGQITMDENPEYQAFVDKFKPKKTTDDCYTPDLVYQVVLDYCVDRYGIDPSKVVRPFWPGADYERMDYPADCVVVDNPPFSIISKICKWYTDRGIRFFLFAPYLTNFSSQTDGLCHVICDADVVYENGANVNTAFVTNMEPGIIARSEPDLRIAIEEASRKAEHNRKNIVELPKYCYPDHVLTAHMLGYMSKHGVRYELREGNGVFIRALDSQRAAKKSIFGSGYLLSDAAAAEKAAAEKVNCIRWTISPREREIIDSMR